MGKKAVALRYDRGDVAPKIVAKGKEKLADVIIKIAKKNKIPLEYNSALCEALMQFDIGEYISIEMYAIIAELLAFVYNLKQE